jgi:hypothetical protein
MEKLTTLDDLTTEMARLRTQIQRDQERLLEMETLIRLATKYNLSMPDTRVTAEGALAIVNAHQHVNNLPSPLTVKELLIRTAERVLSDGKRRLSRELVRDMLRHGVAVPGEDPAGNLSSYLSKEKDTFESDVKAGGWTLKCLLKNARPDEVGASSGLFSNGSQTPHHAG